MQKLKVLGSSKRPRRRMSRTIQSVPKTFQAVEHFPPWTGPGLDPVQVLGALFVVLLLIAQSKPLIVCVHGVLLVIRPQYNAHLHHYTVNNHLPAFFLLRD